ncbi:MAG: hypothetical protein J7496_07170 [Novosphingobium sp.]|nr:hypothetical protein [Novosphingobium sp.]MBO9602272.1 hypothetical protein [Novosphingobium sp.]
MSIYRRDEILPEWEPVPWELQGEAADDQERGFHERALRSISWTPINWSDFPSEGIFGKTRDQLSAIDGAFFAFADGEELFLIDNIWNGWPDPPRWGLISRSPEQAAGWIHWGHFEDIPKAWTAGNSKSPGLTRVTHR